jgi:protein tyrosine phosphatase
VVSAEDMLGFAAQQNATIVNLYGSTENTNYLQRIDKNPLIVRPHNSVGGPDIKITKDYSDKFASGIVSTYSGSSPADTVTILHDLDWVDYSVIPIPNLIDIINKIDTLHDNTTLPSIPIIHCLAGAGRSGTFAAAYVLSRNAEQVRALTDEQATAYLFDIILQLKTQRSALLVEVAPQVEFLTRYMDYLRTGLMPGAPVDSIGSAATDSGDLVSAA